jgi:hypothetical protein
MELPKKIGRVTSSAQYPVKKGRAVPLLLVVLVLL